MCKFCFMYQVVFSVRVDKGNIWVISWPKSESVLPELLFDCHFGREWKVESVSWKRVRTTCADIYLGDLIENRKYTHTNTDTYTHNSSHESYNIAIHSKTKTWKQEKKSKDCEFYPHTCAYSMFSEHCLQNANEFAFRTEKSFAIILQIQFTITQLFFRASTMQSIYTVALWLFLLFRFVSFCFSA